MKDFRGLSRRGNAEREGRERVFGSTPTTTTTTTPLTTIGALWQRRQSKVGWEGKACELGRCFGSIFRPKPGWLEFLQKLQDIPTTQA